MSRPRAVIVVTGSELVRGDRTDLNGPYLAREVLSLGFEPARVEIVGDRPDELQAALTTGLEAELCVVSGGLGPTHDDRTVELLARAAGRELVLDPALQVEIGEITRQVAQRTRRPYTAYAEGIRKQATLPDGALSLGLVGTAPGIVLRHAGGVAVALPGPPRELRQLWPRAVESEPMQALLTRAPRPERRVLRFFGVGESTVAQALASAGGEREGVDVTICARDFEIHVDLIVDPSARERADELESALVPQLENYLFARDEGGVERLVLELCRERDLSLVTAESCTGGLVAARLTSVPGSSEVFLGAVVAYADEVKEAELGVDPALIQQHGAVSAEVAAAMADGARRRLGADVAVSVTGIAGPDGGTPEKPVGLVYIHACGPDGALAADLLFPSDRETIRARATVSALHLVRRLLTQSGHTQG